MDGDTVTYDFVLPRLPAPLACVEAAQRELEKLGNALIEAAAARTDVNPTTAQQRAGNYRKGKVTLHGLVISIESPKGATRSGKSKSGASWSVTMRHHYGYFNGTVGRDKDHIDVFLGPEPEREDLKVYVVNQVDPATGKFDEHKVMLGFEDQAAAKAGYLACYEKCWKGLGSVKEFSLERFKKWILERDHTKRAIDADAFVYAVGAGPNFDPA
jgi:hypothetical protein